MDAYSHLSSLLESMENSQPSSSSSTTSQSELSARDRERLQEAAGGSKGGYFLLLQSIEDQLRKKVNGKQGGPAVDLRGEECWIIVVGWRYKPEPCQQLKSITDLKRLSNHRSISPHSLIYYSEFNGSKLLILDELVAVVDRIQPSKRAPLMLPWRLVPAVTSAGEPEPVLQPGVLELHPKPLELHPRQSPLMQVAAEVSEEPLLQPKLLELHPRRQEAPAREAPAREAPAREAAQVSSRAQESSVSSWDGGNERQSLLVKSGEVLRVSLADMISKLMWGKVMVGGTGGPTIGLLSALLDLKISTAESMRVIEKKQQEEQEGEEYQPFFKRRKIEALLKQEDQLQSAAEDSPPPTYSLDNLANAFDLSEEFKCKEDGADESKFEGVKGVESLPAPQQRLTHRQQLSVTIPCSPRSSDSNSGSRVFGLDRILLTKKKRLEGQEASSLSHPPSESSHPPSSRHRKKAPSTSTSSSNGIGSLLIPEAVRQKLAAHFNKAAAKARRERLAQVTLASILAGPARRQQMSLCMHEGEQGAGEGYKWLRLKVTQKRVRFNQSKIQGWGLFTDEDIEAGEFIVEYVGELIRLPLCEVREKMYRSLGYDDYVFRIDGEFAIDATLTGNVARYINHSCSPNCTTRVVLPVARGGGGRKHVAIMAKRKIVKGEELCYDYKFPWAEREEDRVPCSCGSIKCKGFMC